MFSDENSSNSASGSCLENNDERFSVVISRSLSGMQNCQNGTDNYWL